MRKKPLITVLSKRDNYDTAILQGLCAEQIALDQVDKVEISIVIVDQSDYISVGMKVQSVFNAEPDLIVAIGLVCSQAIMHALRTQKHQIPFIFCGITSLQDSDLEVFLRDNASMITGVSLGYPSYRTMARALLWIKPQVKSVLIPYSPIKEGGVLTSAALLIKEFLATHQITVHLQPLSYDADVISLVREKISSVDVLLALEGCIVDEYYQSLIELCNQHKVTYFSSSLAAVRSGAAVGLINDPGLVGSYAFRKCLGVINNNFMQDKGRILLLKNEGRRIAVNTEACRQQDVFFSPEKWYLVQNLDVLGSFYQLIDNEEQ